MAQRPTADYPIDANTTSGTDLSLILNRFQSALESGNSGSSRPAYITAGGLWVKEGDPMELYLYDGTSDQLLYDTSNGINVTEGLWTLVDSNDEDGQIQRPSDVLIDGSLTVTGDLVDGDGNPISIIDSATEDGVIATWNNADGRWTPEGAVVVDDTGNVGIGVTPTTFDLPAKEQLAEWKTKAKKASWPIVTDGAFEQEPTEELVEEFLSRVAHSGKLQVEGGASINGELRASRSDAGAGAFAAGLSAGLTGQGPYAVAVGTSAGNGNQGQDGVAVGTSAGKISQGDRATALGYAAGFTMQNASATAVGRAAGYENQGTNSLAVGREAGYTNQGEGAVAVGYTAGQTTQGANAVAVGNGSARTNQSTNAVAVGRASGQTDQGSEAVAIGLNAGKTTQNTRAVAVGFDSGKESQGAYSIAVGFGAGQTGQSQQAVSVGVNAGQTSQGENAVAVGPSAGYASQGNDSVAVGISAGATGQGNQSLSIGINAGNSSQGDSAVAIGRDAGKANQSLQAVAVGYGAGVNAQGQDGVAIGYFAGSETQGNNAIAIGRQAGVTNQAANGIIINSTGVEINQTTAEHILLQSGSGKFLNYNGSTAWTFAGGPVNGLSGFRQNDAPVIDAKGLISTLSTLRNATKDETTLEGMRDALSDAIGGLIEKFEHEIATMPALEEPVTLPADEEPETGTMDD